MALILFVLLAASVAGQCSYKKGDLSAAWSVGSDGLLTVNFSNNNISNNQWTAMGFGPNMNDLEVVVFQVQNNRPSSFNGYTTGYAPPMMTANSAVQVQSLALNDKKLSARFTRPLRGGGQRNRDLSQCMSWKFVAGGDLANGQVQKHNRGVDAMMVCPTQCIMQG